jgi:hypothetical protein
MPLRTRIEINFLFVLSRVMAQWLIITCSELDEWICWRLLFTVCLNHSQLQGRNQSSAEPFFHDCLGLTQFWLDWTTLTSISCRQGPRTENKAVLLSLACLLGFPRDRCPAIPLAPRLLPNRGLDAKQKIAPVFLSACLFERVYLATAFWLHSLMLWANSSQYCLLLILSTKM